VNKVKLKIELIPNSCHYSNARTMIKSIEWDKIRKITYEKSKMVCEICGENGYIQGYKNFLECHEVWSYDDINHIQTLVCLESLCPICHLTKHYGRAKAMKKEDLCIKKLAKVNNWTIRQITEHITTSFELHAERSKYEWTLDLSLLNEEPYGLKIKAGKKRIFKKQKYKKKRKTKSKTKLVNKRPKR